MSQLIEPSVARAIALQFSPPCDRETVAHGESLGRTLAEDIHSPLDLPPFDNSAMDGYALLASDVASATSQTPVTLTVRQIIGAGDLPLHAVESGFCLKIMTGAPMPEGADAVVMREETSSRDDNRVAIEASARVGQNIRRRGSDVARGELVMNRGDLVRAAEWAMLASLGCAQVAVFRRPRVAIITTGEELVDVAAPLKEGQIRDSNSFAIEALARDAGAEIVARRRIGDDPGTLRALLDELAAKCDMIISSGGVSAGDFDPVRDVLHQFGRVHFWKIAIKPAKPVLFAAWPHGENEIPVWGLPGNPVSVMVAFELFVRPALLQMSGRRALDRIRVRAAVDADLRSPSGKTEYVRARVTPAAEGWSALISGDQGSGRLSSMTRANALLEVPPDVTRVSKGETLSAMMTDWPETV